MKLIKIQADAGDAFVNLEAVAETAIQGRYVYIEKVSGTVLKLNLASEQEAARLNRLLTNSMESYSNHKFNGKVLV